MIPAGATLGVAVDDLNCGQIDVKAVFTGNGDARGRIAAPFVTTANDCQSAPTTTAPPTTTATTSPTTHGDHRAADRPDDDAIVGEPDLGGRVDDGSVQQLGRPADDGRRHRPARRERPARPGRHRADHQEPRGRRRPAVTLPEVRGGRAGRTRYRALPCDESPVAPRPPS